MSYHEQITTCHPDYADIGEGLHDVIKCSGREGINVGGRVLRNAPMDNLDIKITVLNINPQNATTRFSVFGLERAYIHGSNQRGL